MTSKPKISVNKLGEYITASPTRRKSIVQNQKNPVNFITTRYADARAAYVRFLTQGFDQQHIHDAIALLKKKPTSTDFQQSDKESSIEALERFTEVDFPNLSAFEIVAYAGNTKLDIAGVDISVNPDLIFRGKHKGKSALGAIKFHFVKTAPLNEEARKAVATVLHQFMDEIVKSEDETVPVELIYSIDIFSGKCEMAPKSFKKRRTDIHASCEEYALWWSTL